MSLTKAVIKALKESEFYAKSSYEKGRYFGNLVCPECGDQGAYAYAAKPFSINCNRQNQCGARTSTIKLFNISANLEKQFKPTKEDPHRPAREFLRLRGLPDDLINRIEFEYHAKTRKGCGGGVFFPVEKKKTGKKRLFNGRLFNPPKGQGKTHNTGTLDGRHWQLEGSEYNQDKPVYVTEGIIDALSLISIGKQAVALISAGTNPESINIGKFGTLIFALDNDKAGTAYTQKWLQYCKENDIKATAIMPVSGDWNDLLCNAESLEKARKIFKASEKRYKLQADLALAASAQKYVEIYHENNGGNVPGLFVFRGGYYWSWTKETKEGEFPLSSRASNFTVKVEHYQKSEQDKELPVFNYRLKVIPQKGRPVTVTATGNDLKSPDSLTGFFLRHGKSNWKGKAAAAQAFAELVTQTDAPIIRQAEFTGYDHATGYHVLKDVAVSPTGEVIYPELGGYFKVGNGQYLRPFQIETIKPDICDIKKLYILLIKAWGGNAGVSVAFLVASMFVNQVKPVTKFFPFLSLYNDPQTGKSRLLILLNAMQGLDEEGLPMAGGNTKKGELRTLSQVSGLMKGMVEGNDRAKAQFDFDSILPLYNIGNPLQLKAAFTNDNRVLKMEFHGTLAFVQNREPFVSRAAKERVISLKFSTDDLNNSTKEAYEKLISIPLKDLAGFLVVLKERQFFQKRWEGYFKAAKADLLPAIPDNRINENHALLLAFHRLFCEKFEIDYDLQPYIEQIGKEKIVSCTQRSLTPADFFFDCLDRLPDEITNEIGESYSFKDDFLHIKDGKMFVNKPGAEKAIRAAGMMLDYPERLGASLQDHPAFIRAGLAHRFVGCSSPSKAMVFDIDKAYG